MTLKAISFAASFESVVMIGVSRSPAATSRHPGRDCSNRGRHLGGSAFAAGQNYRSSFDFMSVGVEGQWNPLDLIGKPNTDIPLFLTLGGHVGVLYSDIRQTLDFGGARSRRKRVSSPRSMAAFN